MHVGREVVPEWVDLAAPEWAVSLVHVLALLILLVPEWASLALEEWESLARGEWESLARGEWESQDLAGSGPVEAPGRAVAPGQVTGGQAADGLAGAVAAGGRGGA
jgi:hypothetical protein